MKFCLAFIAALLAVAPVAIDAEMPKAPPPLATADAQGFNVPETCSFVYGDPHLFTFDGLSTDCHGDGDYILAKSRDSDFQIQGRFKAATKEIADAHFAAEGWRLGTGARSIVINTGVEGEPVIEVDADVPGSSQGSCKMVYRVNGEVVDMTAADQELFGGAVKFERRQAWEENIWAKGSYVTNHYRNFYFKESGVFVQVTKKYWDKFGCWMNHRICIPDEIKGQDIVGVLGNANGDKNDDMITRFGEQPDIPPKNRKERNQFCLDNWCVAEKKDSMLSNFNEEDGCSTRADDDLEEAVRNASEEIKALCENDEDCIVDTIVSGDPELGRQTLEEKRKKDEFVEIPPTSDDEREDDTCTTPEGKVVDCDSFNFEFKCEKVGYDFGFMMEGCDGNADGPFQDLTLTDENPTCAVGSYNVGSFDISCSDDGKDATITPTVDTVVKVSGSTTGLLYSGIAKGESFTLSTGEGDKKEVIKNIEFCFKCPTSVVNSELVKCGADVKTCSDGTELMRDASNDCEFPSCPVSPVSGECVLPAEAREFSIVTKDWARIGAHAMYFGMAIGGKLTDESPNESGTVDKTMSFIHERDTEKFNYNFNGGVTYGQKGVDQAFWKKIEYIAENAKSGTVGDYKVVVFDTGGTYNMYDLLPEGSQAEDNGKTLALFNTDEDITITKTADGRQFGPTIIAPNSLVKVNEDAGYVDGAIIAKQLIAYGGALQLHGDMYEGSITCEGDDNSDRSGPEDTLETKEVPESLEPEDEPEAEKDSSNSCAPMWGRCGGKNWEGPTTCVIGASCEFGNDWYSQCKPAPLKEGTVALWGQCGGGNYNGPTTCTPGSICVYGNPWYSQCKRDPNPSCPGEEPQVICAADMTTCTDGSVVGRTGPDCEFKCPLPEPCPEEMPASGDKCNFEGYCPYGVEMCCDGTERPSHEASCVLGAVESLSSSGCRGVICETPGPTAGLTAGPTTSPTAGPTTTPDDQTYEEPAEETQTEPPIDRMFAEPPKEKASGSGDPHFKTWTGAKFDYHGECDLVLVDNPSFADGMGLKVHIRTTRVNYFSYIERVAIQIGEEVLEFSNDVNNFFINGKPVEANRKHHKTMLAGFLVRRDPKSISIRLNQESRKHSSSVESRAKIDLIARKNGFPAIKMDGANTDIFAGSLGLLGEWSTGKKLARDGKTEMNDPDATAFALEWQVRDTEPMLFEEARFPQYPTQCTPPKKVMRSRLGRSHMEKAAEEACSHWKEDKEDCIFDVIATRDVLVAAEGSVVA